METGPLSLNSPEFSHTSGLRGPFLQLLRGVGGPTPPPAQAAAWVSAPPSTLTLGSFSCPIRCAVFLLGPHESILPSSLLPVRFPRPLPKR